MLSKIKTKLIVIIAQIWMNTLRIHIHGGKIPEKNGIIALWHEDLPVCTAIFKNRGFSVLISESKDGQIAAEACAGWGYRVFRGSSSRGGAAGMRKLLRDVAGTNSNRLAGMALDGPAGPYHHINPGTGWLSHKADIPVYPCVLSYQFSLRLNNWDRTVIPRPFSRVDVYIAGPLIPHNDKLLESAMLNAGKKLKTLNSRAPGPGLYQ